MRNDHAAGRGPTDRKRRTAHLSSPPSPCYPLPICRRQTDLFKAELARPNSTNVSGLVLRARALMREFSCSKNAEAMRLLERALQTAPEDSSVLRAMSRLHTYNWLYGWTESPEQSQAAGVDWARRAILCDPLDDRAYAELGVAYLHRRQIDEAVAEFDRAVALNPNDADVLVEYSDALKYAGKGKKAISQIRRAMRLNPYYPDWYLWYMADAYDCLGRPAEVVMTARRMQNPQEASRLVAANLSHLGEIKDARAMARQVLHAHPEFRVGAWRRRQPWQNRESAERFFEGMRRAGLPE
jgi:adenylate cyclase